MLPADGWKRWFAGVVPFAERTTALRIVSGTAHASALIAGRWPLRTHSFARECGLVDGATATVVI